MRRTTVHLVDVEAAFGHDLCERLAAVHAHRLLELVGLEQAERHAAAEVAAVLAGEPAAGLFRADAHYGEILRRFESSALERRQRSNSGDHACGAVVIAALRDRVQMRAG